MRHPAFSLLVKGTSLSSPFFLQPVTISKRRLPASLVLAFPIQVEQWDHSSPGPFSSRRNYSVRGNGGENHKVSTSSQTGCRFQGPQTKGETLYVDRMPKCHQERWGASSDASHLPSYPALVPHFARDHTVVCCGRHSYLDQSTAFPLIILQTSLAFT